MSTKHDPVVLDGDVGGGGRPAGAVDDRPSGDDQSFHAPLPGF
jgi:hypothetical protein